ncbi:hypothetical protein F511_16592 [Dorcoceras hygrometricum]|uniref:Uncharacterized protein n=1 Tax=Dorcoceras hygrometricum TaxID=472368 RepID=A0A2Z7BIR5_9LAMI|nr:hypothetical protein F511_16592 [Dorcoceras hygrometricum]
MRPPHALRASAARPPRLSSASAALSRASLDAASRKEDRPLLHQRRAIVALAGRTAARLMGGVMRTGCAISRPLVPRWLGAAARCWCPRRATMADAGRTLAVRRADEARTRWPDDDAWRRRLVERCWSRTRAARATSCVCRREFSFVVAPPPAGRRSGDAPAMS